jgi:hypothetical protein
MLSLFSARARHSRARNPRVARVGAPQARSRACPRRLHTLSQPWVTEKNRWYAPSPPSPPRGPRSSSTAAPSVSSFPPRSACNISLNAASKRSRAHWRDRSSRTSVNAPRAPLAIRADHVHSERIHVRNRALDTQLERRDIVRVYRGVRIGSYASSAGSTAQSLASSARATGSRSSVPLSQRRLFNLCTTTGLANLEREHGDDTPADAA